MLIDLNSHRDKRLNVLEHVVNVVDRQAERLGHTELPVVVLDYYENIRLYISVKVIIIIVNILLE